MKNFKSYFGLILITGLLLIGSCSDVFDLPEQNGESVTIIIDDDIGRSLMPGTPWFSYYELTFTPGSGQAPLAEPVVTNWSSSSYTLILERGWWTVSVKGFVYIGGLPGIEYGYYEAASSDGAVWFNAGESGSNSVQVPVRGRMQDEEPGIFAWNLENTFTSGSVTITSGTLDILDPFEEQIGFEQINLMDESSGSISLAPGYYMLKVEFTNLDGNKAYKTEIMHIYSNLTTSANNTTGYYFNSSSFAPMTDMYGYVYISTDEGLNPQGSVVLYRDSDYLYPIENTNNEPIELQFYIDSNYGYWSFRLSSYYGNVYPKITVNYDGFDPVVIESGPVNVSSTGNAGQIYATLRSISGTVLFDEEVELENTPYITIYSISGNLLGTANIIDNYWSTIIHPNHQYINLTANVDYVGFNVFSLSQNSVNTNSTMPSFNAALINRSGIVTFDDTITDFDSPPVVELYLDSDYSTKIGESIPISTIDGSWNVLITPNITSVYIKVTVDYTGFEPIVMQRGASISYVNPAEWNFNAELAEISGVVQLDSVVALEENLLLSIYSDPDYSVPIVEDVEIINVAGNWTIKVASTYTDVYMKAIINYYDYEPFELRKAVINIDFSTIEDRTINAELIPVSGTLQHDSAAIKADISVLSIYSDMEYTQLITSMNLPDATNASWNYKLAPIYTTVYLEASVEYYDYSAFVLRKPVSVTSTVPADWNFNAELLHRSGNLQLQGGVELDNDPVVELYNFDNTLITTVTTASNGNWNITLTPDYTTVYLKAIVNYTDYDVMERAKGPILTSSTNAADWTINCFFPNSGDIIIGDPSVKLLYNGTDVTGQSTNVPFADPGTFTVSIASGIYSQIRWYVNGNLAADDPTRTSITLPRRTVGTYLVTVEATTGGVMNTGTHTFVVVQE